jgi:hypothetical protein
MGRRREAGSRKQEWRGVRAACALTLLSVAVIAQGSAERALEAAIYREVVAGDLKGAIEQYRAIVGQADAPKTVAASALLHMGGCYEKLGQRRQAHESYTRVLRDFESESAAAAAARARIDIAEALPGPANLRFDKDEAGSPPAHGWFVPSMENVTGNLSEVRRKGCRGKNSCAVLIAPVVPPDSTGRLMQSFSAAAYRGKFVKFSAWMKMDAGSPADHAQIFMQTDGPNRRSGFRSERDLQADLTEQAFPKVPGWHYREVTGRVDKDAQFLELGFSAYGHGQVWIDEVTFEVTAEER